MCSSSSQLSSEHFDLEFGFLCPIFTFKRKTFSHPKITDKDREIDLKIFRKDTKNLQQRSRKNTQESTKKDSRNCLREATKTETFFLFTSLEVQFGKEKLKLESLTLKPLFVARQKVLFSSISSYGFVFHIMCWNVCCKMCNRAISNRFY